MGKKWTHYYVGICLALCWTAPLYVDAKRSECCPTRVPMIHPLWSGSTQDGPKWRGRLLPSSSKGLITRPALKLRPWSLRVMSTCVCRRWLSFTSRRLVTLLKREACSLFRPADVPQSSRRNSTKPWLLSRRLYTGRTGCS